MCPFLKATDLENNLPTSLNCRGYTRSNVRVGLAAEHPQNHGVLALKARTHQHTFLTLQDLLHPFQAMGLGEAMHSMVQQLSASEFFLCSSDPFNSPAQYPLLPLHGSSSEI